MVICVRLFFMVQDECVYRATGQSFVGSLSRKRQGSMAGRQFVVEIDPVVPGPVHKLKNSEKNVK